MVGHYVPAGAGSADELARAPCGCSNQVRLFHAWRSRRHGFLQTGRQGVERQQLLFLVGRGEQAAKGVVRPADEPGRMSSLVSVVRSGSPRTARSDRKANVRSRRVNARTGQAASHQSGSHVLSCDWRRGRATPLRRHQRVMLTAPRVLGTGCVIVRRSPSLRRFA